jgi:hypothetical protein
LVKVNVRETRVDGGNAWGDEASGRGIASVAGADALELPAAVDAAAAVTAPTGLVTTTRARNTPRTRGGQRIGAT